MENIDTTPFLRVKELAKKKNLTLSQLAINSGLGENSIYRWKQRNPSAKNLKKVADVLGVSVDYLLGNTNEMNPTNSKAETSTDDLKDYFESHQIMRYDGKPIPDSDMEVIKRILESH